MVASFRLLHQYLDPAPSSQSKIQLITFFMEAVICTIQKQTTILDYQMLLFSKSVFLNNMKFIILLLIMIGGSLEKTINIFVIGDVSGKTSLSCMMTHNIFPNNGLGPHGITSRNKIITINKQSVRLSVWDSYSPLIYTKIIQQKMSRTKPQAIILTYNITRPQTYQRVRMWKHTISEKYKENEVLVFVVGTFLDQKHLRQIQPNQPVLDFKMQQEIDCWQVSNKTGENIDKMMASLIKRIWFLFKYKIEKKALETIGDHVMDNQYLSQTAFYQDQMQIVKEDQQNSSIIKSIGAITSLNDRKQLCVGSGVLISNRIVLTAANCIYGKKYGEVNTDIKFYQPIAGKSCAAKFVEKAIFHDYKQKTNKGQFQLDYAILILKKQNSQHYYSSIQYPCQTCLGHPKVSLELYGYPVCGQNYKKQVPSNQLSLSLYGLSRSDILLSTSLANGMIRFAMKPEAGQNGSPIFVDNCIVGIYIGNNIMSQKCCIGKIITLDMLEKINKWIEPDRFTIKYCQHARQQIARIKQLRHTALLSWKEQNMLMAVEKYQLAASLFQKYLVRDEEYADTCFKLGTIYFNEIKSYSSAVQNYRKSLEIYKQVKYHKMIKQVQMQLKDCQYKKKQGTYFKKEELAARKAK